MNRAARMETVRRDYRDGRITYPHAIRELRRIYPSLTLDRAGLTRLLTED